MSDNYNNIMVEINDYLNAKELTSLKAKLVALHRYVKDNKNDEVRVRAANVMIKSYGREYRRERFTIFMQEKAKISKKKLRDLTKEEVLKYKSDFDRMEALKKDK